MNPVMRYYFKETKMKDLEYQISIRLFRGKKCFGPGIYQLLKQIEQTGSLHRAAAEMDMAYSKAWKILKECEESYGIAFTIRNTGGAAGGGSVLSEEGKKLMSQYEGFCNEIRQKAEESFQKWFETEAKGEE